VRIQQTEAAQVQARARDQGDLLARAFQFGLDGAGEAQLAVLFGRGELLVLFAEGRDAGPGADARAQGERGEQQAKQAKQDQIATLCEPSS
jgi:hypothetical protein